jgi:hypothetical protein
MQKVKGRLLLLATLMSTTELGVAAVQPLELLPEGSTTLCIEEKSNGFQWENSSWNHARFKPEFRYVIKKLPLSSYASPKDRLKNKTFLCGQSKVNDYSEKEKGFSGFISACYEIKRMGKEAGALDSQTCDESWSDGKLLRVSCSNHRPSLYFVPDGPFIRFPWHSDLSNAKDKDSLNIGVGSCSRL